VAAVSAGLWRGQAILDLNYAEDKDAAVDANIVLTGAGRFVEIQGAGEEATFSAEELAALLALARTGLAEICAAQQQALAG
jgi:ribonuclease PH